MEENKETCNKIDKISWSDNQKDLISEKNIKDKNPIIEELLHQFCLVFAVGIQIVCICFEIL